MKSLTKLVLIAAGATVALIASTLISTSEAQAMNTENKKTEAISGKKSSITAESEAIFPKGNPASKDYFTGTVYVQPLVNSGEIEGLYTVGSVTFEPGGRTHWHTHPKGQVLLVTGGKGFYQERGRPARPIAKGDVVAIPKDVEHWHGAAENSSLVHVAISNMMDGSNVVWMAPVNDEEYNGANR